MSRQSEQITAADARTAFYVTFAGAPGRAPVLMGSLRKGGVQQVVVDPVFAPAGPTFVGLREAVSGVVTRAQKQDRRIVAWSDDDIDIVRSLTNEPGLIRAFEARYADGRAIAARWAERTNGIDRPAADELGLYLAPIRLDGPETAGSGRVAKALRSLRPSLEAGRMLTEHQAAAWADVLEQNRFACEGLRALCIRAATDLERIDQRTRKARKGRKKRRPSTGKG